MDDEQRALELDGDVIEEGEQGVDGSDPTLSAAAGRAEAVHAKRHAQRPDSS